MLLCCCCAVCVSSPSPDSLYDLHIFEYLNAPWAVQANWHIFGTTGCDDGQNKTTRASKNKSTTERNTQARHTQHTQNHKQQERTTQTEQKPPQERDTPSCCVQSIGTVRIMHFIRFHKHVDEFALFLSWHTQAFVDVLCLCCCVLCIQLFLRFVVLVLVN